MSKLWFRRLNSFSYFKIQFQLASVFFLWFVVFLGVFSFIFFVNFQATASKTAGMSIHDELLTKSILINQSRELAFYYGTAAVIYFILVWAYLIVYAHRLTGPIYKLNMILKKSIHNAEWPKTPVKFRKNDAFHDLAQNFNLFVETMQKKSK